MAVAGEKAHGRAVALDDQPVAVVFDLVNPVRPGRRSGCLEGWQGGMKPEGRRTIMRTEITQSLYLCPFERNQHIHVACTLLPESEQRLILPARVYQEH